MFSSHSSKNCEVEITTTYTGNISELHAKDWDLKETLWITLRENSRINVAPLPEHLTVSCIGQKPTHTEITGSGVLAFLSVSTGHGNT